MDVRTISLPLKLLTAGMFLFLLAPVVIVIPISFSGDVYMSFPPSSWSLRWYNEVAHSPRMLSAFRTSLLLAATVTVVGLAIALPAAYALVRLTPPGAGLVLSLLTAPLLLPTIVLGLGMLIVFASHGLLATYPGLLIAHLVVTLPYSLRILVTGLANLPPAAEEAASTLGASPLGVVVRVTLPMMGASIAAAAALCFLVSFDEVVISLFMTGPKLTTLPVEMYHYVEDRADPLVAALSVVLVSLTLVIVLFVDRTMGLGRAFLK